MKWVKLSIVLAIIGHGVICHVVISSLKKEKREAEIQRRILIERQGEIREQIETIEHRRLIEDSLRKLNSPEYEEQIRLIHSASASDLERIIRSQVSDSLRLGLFLP
jgi:hypothetical protein